MAKREPVRKPVNLVILMDDGMISGVYSEGEIINCRAVILEGPYGDESQIGVHTLNVDPIWTEGFGSLDQFVEEISQEYGFYEMEDEE